MSDMYLTAQQYLDLMKAIRKDLDDVKDIFSEDCTEIGFKHTVTNVGLCAGDISKSGTWYKDRHVTRETAMWPKDFDKIGKVKYEYPQQYSRKYRKDRQVCPLDARKRGGLNGCFYTCMVFNPKKGSPKLTLDMIKKLYDDKIKEVEGRLKCQTTSSKV